MREAAFADVKDENEDDADEKDEDEKEDLNENPHDFIGFFDVQVFPLDAVGLHETCFELEFLSFENEIVLVLVFEVRVLFGVEFEHFFARLD